MLDCMKKAVDYFACMQWWKRDTLKSVLLPHVLYIPSHLQEILVRNFHTICSRADLADILLEWEHVGSDSDIFRLFDVIQECNREFDDEHAARKMARDQKAAATRQMKVAVASAGMCNSDRHNTPA